MTKMLTVEDVLSTRAEFDHVVEVRSIAPALILVLERDAPMRMAMLSSTESEFLALQEEVASSAEWAGVLNAFFEGCDELREHEHADRLSNGQRISTLRVTEK